MMIRWTTRRPLQRLILVLSLVNVVHGKGFRFPGRHHPQQEPDDPNRRGEQIQHVNVQHEGSIDTETSRPTVSPLADVPPVIGLSKSQQSQPPPPPSQDTAGTAAAVNGLGWTVESLNHEILDLIESGFQRLGKTLDTHFPFTKGLPTRVRSLVQRFVSFLMYKPPVGIVTVLTLSRLVFSGRLFTLDTSKHTAVDSAMRKEHRRRTRERTRSLTLDHDDANYQAYGGIDRVRCRLLWAAFVGLRQDLTAMSTTTNVGDTTGNDNMTGYPPVEHIPRGGVGRLRLRRDRADANQDTSSDRGISADTRSMLEQMNIDFDSSKAEESHLINSVDNARPVVEALITALSVDQAITGATRLDFALEVAPALARLEYALESPEGLSALLDLETSYMDGDQMLRLVAMAVATVQVRAMDAILRICRDRLLKTTHRLAKTYEHWQRRVQNQNVFITFFQRRFRSTADGDRLRLSYAHAAYIKEVKQLGEVASLLMQRPSDMEEERLLDALRITEHEEKAQADPTASTTTTTTSTPLQRPWKLPLLSRYHIRFDFRGGLFSIRKFDTTDGYISGQSAAKILLQEQQQQQQQQQQQGNVINWMTRAQTWTQATRSLLCRVVRESLQIGGSTGSYNSRLDSMDFADLEENLCMGKKSSDADQWTKLVQYVHQLDQGRRVGEGRAVRLQDAEIIDWTRRLDLFGIPSAALTIWASYVFHDKVIRPYWKTFQEESIQIFRKTSEIVLARIWRPLKGIYDDIMNKSPGMMSAFGLEREQASLDRMLRDLGFGDGTSDQRGQALEEATEQYEHDLANGVFLNLARGRLVRLLLLQVQQLKVGMLSALETIDVLLRGNRIHFQVLAAIPAVLGITYGFRWGLQALYNIRARDLRPVRVVHGEMARYLNQMESLVLLSQGTKVKLPETTYTSSSSSSSSSTGADTSKKNTDDKTTIDNNNNNNNNNNDGSKSSAAVLLLDPKSLGEWLLNMHRYLILLDYSSPPFATPDCDQIHDDLQEIVQHRLLHISQQQQQQQQQQTQEEDQAVPTSTSTAIHEESNKRTVLALVQRIEQSHQDLLKQL